MRYDVLDRWRNVSLAHASQQDHQHMRIIAGSARGKKLATPSGRSVRPALDHVREAVFSILGERVEQSRVLDLFAGVGAFGLEALSRGARHVTFVERSDDSMALLERNIVHLSFQRQTTCVRGDALFVPDFSVVDTPFDLVFVDPPFPMFSEARSASRVFARIGDYLCSDASSDDSAVVMRIPSSYSDPLPFHPLDERTFGRSRVAFLRRPRSS